MQPQGRLRSEVILGELTVTLTLDSADSSLRVRVTHPAEGTVMRKAYHLPPRFTQGTYTSTLIPPTTPPMPRAGVLDSSTPDSLSPIGSPVMPAHFARWNTRPHGHSAPPTPTSPSIQLHGSSTTITTTLAPDADSSGDTTTTTVSRHHLFVSPPTSPRMIRGGASPPVFIDARARRRRAITLPSKHEDTPLTRKYEEAEKPGRRSRSRRSSFCSDDEARSTVDFKLIPVEILQHIFSYLSPSACCRASQVCLTWATAAHDDTMWAVRFKDDFGSSVFDLPWRRKYFLIQNGLQGFEKKEAHTIDKSRYKNLIKWAVQFQLTHYMLHLIQIGSRTSNTIRRRSHSFEPPTVFDGHFTDGSGEREIDRQNKNVAAIATYALYRGQLDIIRALVFSGALDFKTVFKGGSTILHIASEKGHLNVARFLLEQYKIQEKKSAIWEDEEEDFESELPSSTNLMSTSSATVTLPRNKVSRSVERLVNKLDSSGRTALILAVSNNHRGIAKLLLENGANLALNHHGVSPLFLAVQRDHVDIARLLLRYDTDRATTVNAPGTKQLETPLHVACERGSVAMAELLLVHNADVNAADRTGMTPLIQAVLCRKRSDISVLVDLVRLLLSRGAGGAAADLARTVADGNNALMSACSIGRVEIVSLLLNEGQVRTDLVNNSSKPAFAIALRSPTKPGQGTFRFQLLLMFSLSLSLSLSLTHTHAHTYTNTHTPTYLHTSPHPINV
eukprot:TRINITY_DN4809_c0_g1_i1.p1 TRINITY_DN4809_c0_g1~~TRINITY_DN4809_c0_g1_i1.p1  ORF type:complete len:731 (-),score=96.35 TRINITY_DN4809_c0_g1_i1:261-2453(-)